MSKKNKKGISDSEIISKYSKLKVPISVLRDRPLTTYESLIVYLKDDSGFNYHNIAVLLDRNERGIRITNLRTKDKLKNVADGRITERKEKFTIKVKGKKNQRGLSDSEIISKYSKLKVPISALRKRPLTTYESLIAYLNDDSALNYHTIAVLIDRDERDVRKVYFRAKNKLKNAK